MPGLRVFGLWPFIWELGAVLAVVARASSSTTSSTVLVLSCLSKSVYVRPLQVALLSLLKRMLLDEMFTSLQNELSSFFTLAILFHFTLSSSTNGLLIKRRAVRLVVVVSVYILSGEQGNLLRQLLALFVLSVGTRLTTSHYCAPHSLSFTQRTLLLMPWIDFVFIMLMTMAHVFAFSAQRSRLNGYIRWRSSWAVVLSPYVSRM